MNEAEQIARLRIMEAAMKFLLRNMQDPVADKTIDHLIDIAEGNPQLQFVAEEWRQDMDAGQMTIGEATRSFLDHQKQRAEVFGYDAE